MPENTQRPKQGFLSRRRSALFASVAIATVLVTGIGGYSYREISLLAPAHAAEMARPAGFADIVEKVKPAVISIKVRLSAPS